ncbi:MAG: hypothetical protein KGQ93_03565 [Cyanobacteria bacterium REEB459]|nr:hypothetical protein [Cyanobacteria bacterium REEB459]
MTHSSKHPGFYGFTGGLGRRVALQGMGAFLVVGLVNTCSPDQPQASSTLSYEAQLAQHLTATGSLMYGAYWCPHCADQKALFGDAANQIPYVECAVDGENAQSQRCRQRGIKGYPTWDIGGQLYPGVASLDQLATLSGYQLPR